jgi:hypothetical protein
MAAPLGIGLPQMPVCHKADGSRAGWAPVIEIADLDLLDQ